jgi:hypothetical protein
VTASQLLATPELFTRWLENRDPRTVVGEANSQDAYPLVQFLRAHGHDCLRICGLDMAISGQPRLIVPEWVGDFLWLLDVTACTWEGHDGCEMSHEVTAKNCLTALRSITRPRLRLVGAA